MPDRGRTACAANPGNRGGTAETPANRSPRRLGDPDAPGQHCLDVLARVHLLPIADDLWPQDGPCLHQVVAFDERMKIDRQLPPLVALGPLLGCRPPSL